MNGLSYEVQLIHCELGIRLYIKPNLLNLSLYNGIKYNYLIYYVTNLQLFMYIMAVFLFGVCFSIHGIMWGQYLALNFGRVLYISLFVFPYCHLIEKNPAIVVPATILHLTDYAQFYIFLPVY